MKNSFIVVFLIVFLNLPNFVFSDTLDFESKNLEITEKGNIINAFKGKAISKDKNLELYSDKFTYFKNFDLLESIGNGELIIKSNKLKINFDKATLREKSTIFEGEGNIKVTNLNNNFTIKTNKVFYDKNKNIIKSESVTKVEDKIGNIYLVDSFYYDVDKNLLKVQNLIAKDLNENTFKTEIAYINTNSEKIFAKDIKINLKDSFLENKPDYKLRGNSVEINKDYSKIKKGIFTTCKKTNSCPPWQFNAKEIHHDKIKRQITYKDAFLKIYDIPIAYFPKFFHPDPTVKRRSGFLIPSIQNSSNSGNFLNLPYYHVLSENKDITFSPRFYTDEKILIQTEYRQKNFESDHIADFSFLNDKSDNDNHFFYEYNKKIDLNNFENSKLNLKLQSSSSEGYLISNKLESELVDENNILENSINIDLFSNDTSITFDSTIYEDLSKKNNDRYEFIFPSLKLTKSYENLKNSGLNLLANSDYLIRHFNTNVFEKKNTNSFLFNSNIKNNNLGFLNDHNLLIRNTNSENKNSNYKNYKSSYFSALYQFNSSLPLIKDNNDYQNIFKPKFSLKIAPNHSKNETDLSRKINNTNIYSLDRATDESSIEGGVSLAYGVDYSSYNKEKSRNILNLKIANNLRLKKNNALINTNQIGEKTSNIFSEMTYDPNNYLTIRYNSAIKNNINDLAYENLITEFEFNKITTSFDYLNDNDVLEKSSYISNTTKYSLNEFNNLSFSTRKNKTKDLTEYYNFMYQYKNDCLAASIEYKKDFYTDGISQNDETLFFKLSIIPFAELNTPQIN